MVKYIQGDVVGVYNSTGTNKVAEYAYDAYGNCTIVSQQAGVGTLNPFRYRGYYWDSDLGLYYLQTRYYDPVTGRFINADENYTLYLGLAILGGLSRYSYCFDDPVDYIDDCGWWPKRNDKFKPRKPPRKGSEKRRPSGSRERNVGHPQGEEHSRVPKGGKNTHMELVPEDFMRHIYASLNSSVQLICDNTSQAIKDSGMIDDNDEQEYINESKDPYSSDVAEDVAKGVLIGTAILIFGAILLAPFTAGQSLWVLVAL